ncbi:hypothetical protein EDC04DRAFT_2702438 [Pisolithus marmoratus]|nr:hypothetical protein EDC04DRAFT_2702438 [Pisolithus marmoratus]
MLASREVATIALTTACSTTATHSKQWGKICYMKASSTPLDSPMARMRFARRTVQQRTGIQDMPQEILLMICILLPLLDLVSLSQVSRAFWFLLKDEHLWKVLYRTTKIVRPPGPLAGHPVHCLPPMSKKNWPPLAKKPEFTKIRTVPLIDPPEYCYLLWGRWLIAANSSVGYYYDLCEQSKPQPVLFYRPHLLAVFFRCVTATNVHGDSLTFLITETQLGKEERKVHIGKVSTSMTGPVVEPLMHYDLPQNYPGIADTNYVHVQPTVYDFKDLRPCKLPAIPTEYHEHLSFYHAEYVMTKSYVLLLYTFAKAHRSLETVVLACPTTPVTQKNESVLRISHRAVVEGLVLANIRVMCDDTCKSGTTEITLVGKKVTNCRAANAGLMALRLTLPPPIEDEPEGLIDYRCIDLGTIPGRDGIWLEVGPDECGRGVYNTPTGRIVLFSIEPDNDSLRWHKSQELSCGPGLIRHSAMAFDGYRGMVCVKTVNTARNVELEVWTITRSTR